MGVDLEFTSFSSIGYRLETAFKASGLDIDAVINGIVSDGTWYRIIRQSDDGNEVGWLTLCRLGARLGLTPQQLFLADGGIDREDKRKHFNDRDYHDLRKLLDVLDQLCGLGGNTWGERPPSILLDHCERILKEAKRRAENRRTVAMPGTVVAAEGPVKTYAPADTPTKSSGKAGEAAAQYGKKKRGK